MINPRPPLPRTVMENTKYIPWIALSLVIIGLGSLVLTVHKRIQLVINGEGSTHPTFALTVGGVLRQQGIQVTKHDEIHPPLNRILWGGERITIQRASRVTVIKGGDRSQIITVERKPANILAKLDIPLFPQDQISSEGERLDPEASLPFQPHHTLRIQSATPVTVKDGDKSHSFTSVADTVGGALWEADIPLYAGDVVTPPANTPLSGTPTQVEIERALPLQIKLRDKTIHTRTTADTVGGALSEAGVTLQGRDHTNPPEDDPLPDDGIIEVVRVEEKIIIEQEPIPFSVAFQAASDLELDERRILEGGEYGLSARRVRVIYENGTETSRITEKEWTAKEPQPRVIGYGTKIVVRTADTADGQIRYWRKITAYATSYDETCPGCDSITASGTVLKKGTVAVTLEWYRSMQGLNVYIPGYGHGTIEDVGAGIAGEYWVDLGYRHENYVPWHQDVTVYFLAPPPPPQNIMYILN